MKRTATIAKSATAPTNHPHPLLTDAVAQTRERADRLAAEASADRCIARNHPRVAALLDDGAREHAEPEPEVDFAEVAAALPGVIDRAMRTAVPERYTPEFADEFARTMAALLVQARQEGHTAPLLAPEQSTLALDEGLGAWITAPVETALLDIDSDRDPDLVHAPFLAAQVVNYRSEEFGHSTEVWVHHGSSTGAVSPAKAREVLAAMRAFLPQLEAVIELAEEAEAGA